MNSSNASAAQARGRRCKGHQALGFVGLGFLAFGFTAGLAVPPTEAQFLRSWTWDADEGPPPMPPGYVGQRAASSSAVPSAEIRRRANLAGLRLLAAPHRKGDVYIAFGTDAHGLLHRLTFDAHHGTLIENQTSGGGTKEQAIDPTASPAATPHQPPSSQAMTASPAPDKAAAPSPTVTARELSPIEPQPGLKAAPTPKDSDIDKD